MRDLVSSIKNFRLLFTGFKLLVFVYTGIFQNDSHFSIADIALVRKIGTY